MLRNELLRAINAVTPRETLHEWGRNLLDTHEYDGVSVLRCGAECCDVIDC
jgi:hypothetical protein